MCAAALILYTQSHGHNNSLNRPSHWRNPPFSNWTSYVTELNFEYWSVQMIWQPRIYSKKGLVLTFTPELIYDFGSTVSWFRSSLPVALIRTDRSLEAFDWEGRPSGEFHFWPHHWLWKGSDCFLIDIMYHIITVFRLETRLQIHHLCRSSLE